MLERVQKLATLQITGGFVTTPNITLNLLAGIWPIEIKLELIAVKTAMRLKVDQNWFGQYAAKEKGKLTSHAYYLDKKLKNIKTFQELEISDLLPKINITHKYNTECKDSSVIDHRIKNIPTNVIKIFTDGSVKKYINHNDQRAGAGITISKHKEIVFEQSYSLGSYPTINQCELFAINQAAHWLNIMNPPNTSIHIFSDSETTLHINSLATILDQIQNLSLRQIHY